MTWSTVGGSVTGRVLFATVFRPGVGPTQPPSGYRGLVPRGKIFQREAEQTSITDANVKNAWSCTSTPQHVFMA
jgi:hypothetical protein